MNKILLFFFVILFNITPFFSQIQKKQTPLWVQEVDYNLNPNVDLEEVVEGNLILLYDEQINVDRKENYFHFSTKITDNVGIQPASSINLTFDPSYQSLILHRLKIIRSGKTIDKLKSSDFQTIRRELNAETYIYDGSLSAFTNISDVRVGDIIDYSYTIKGRNPIHKNLYSAFFNLSFSQPCGKMAIKIISSKEIEYKLFKTDLTLNKVQKKGNYIYSIVEENIKTFKYEEATPSWYIHSGILNISNYKSWENVIDWGVKVFEVKDKLSASLKKEISDIEKQGVEEGDKINNVLNFVQDEIRYLGLESGIGAYKPFSPNKVFEQRYGDCKDKSLLMVAMLRAMKIEAYPVLVSTYLKGTIKEFLPATEHFNHCVVKVIDKYKNELWFDPTISNQGGNYKDVSFPDYRYGLVLKKGNKEFDYISSSSLYSTDVTDVFIIDKEGKGADLNISSVYYGGEADYMRKYYKNNSISSIQKEYEKYYTKYFNSINSIKKPKYKDDLKNNIFTINENYRIDSLWEPLVNEKQIGANFYPYTIVDVISMPTKLERKTPFLLSYPIERNHTIKIYLPENWRMNQDSFSVNSPNIFYDQDVYYNAYQKLLTINHSFKTKKDHVEVDDFSQFFSDLQLLDKQVTYNIITTSQGLLRTNVSSSFWLKIIGVLIFFIAISVSVWLALRLYKYNPIPEIETYFELNKKIGGWLVLIGIGLCFSPFNILIDLFENRLYVNGNWILYFGNTNIDFSPLLGFTLFLETIVNAILVVYYPLAIILFFEKRSSFPKIHSFFLIGFFLFTLFDNLVAGSYLDEHVSNTLTKNLLQVFIASSLVVPYLLLSDRAKETFVKLRKDR